MKMNDPFVEEVRAARMKHTQKFHGDLKLICEDLRRIQREIPDRIVRGQPKRHVPIGWPGADQLGPAPSSHTTPRAGPHGAVQRR
jgi:hypothetical protein